MSTSDNPGPRPPEPDGPTSWAPPSSAPGGAPADAWGAAPDPDDDGWGSPAPAPGWNAPGSSPTPSAGAGGAAGPGGPTGVGGPGGPGAPGGPAVPGAGWQGDRGWQAPPGGAGWAPAPQPGVIPLRPLQLGDLFDGTFRAIRSNPAVMFGFSVAVLALLSLVGAGLQAAFSGSFYSIVDDPQAALQDDATAAASGIAGMLVSNFATSALAIIATTILSGILALTVSDAVLGRVTSLGGAWARVRPRLWPLIACSLLVGLIQAVVLVVVVGVFSVPLVMAFTSGSDPGAWVVLPILLGLLVAVAATVAVTVRLLFAPMAVVLEDLGPVAGIKRSWGLSSGSFWRICGRLLLIGLITAVASGIVGGAVGILGSLFVLVTSPTVGLAISVFLSGTVSGLVVPISASFETLMYVDERMRRENLAPVLARAAQEG